MSQQEWDKNRQRVDQLTAQVSKLTKLVTEQNQLTDDSTHSDLVEQLNRTSQELEATQDRMAQLEAETKAAQETAQRQVQAADRKLAEQQQSEQGQAQLNRVLDDLAEQYGNFDRQQVVQAVDRQFLQAPVSRKDDAGDFVVDDQTRHDWILAKLEAEALRQVKAGPSETTQPGTGDDATLPPPDAAPAAGGGAATSDEVKAPAPVGDMTFDQAAEYHVRQSRAGVFG